MIRVASVELYRQGETSPMVAKTYHEEVRGVRKIEWTPRHVVFHMNDDIIVAYNADRVHEVVTSYEQ
jgi:hypothetical protein